MNRRVKTTIIRDIGDFDYIADVVYYRDGVALAGEFDWDVVNTRPLT